MLSVPVTPATLPTQIRPPPDFKEELLYLNSTVTLYSRQLKLIEYGDDFTKARMQAKHER